MRIVQWQDCFFKRLAHVDWIMLGCSRLLMVMLTCVGHLCAGASSEEEDANSCRKQEGGRDRCR